MGEGVEGFWRHRERRLEVGPVGGEEMVLCDRPKGKIRIASTSGGRGPVKKGPERDSRPEGSDLEITRLSRGSWKRSGPKGEAHDLRVQVPRHFFGRRVSWEKPRSWEFRDLIWGTKCGFQTA